MTLSKSILSAFLAFNLAASSALATTPPTVDQSQIDAKFERLDISEMSDAELLQGLQEVEALITARSEQIESAAHKNGAKRADFVRTVSISAVGLGIIGFIVLTKNPRMTSATLSVGSFLGIVFGGFGLVTASAMSSDTYLATLHDTEMSDAQIESARHRLNALKERVSALRSVAEKNLLAQKKNKDNVVNVEVAP